MIPAVPVFDAAPEGNAAHFYKHLSLKCAVLFLLSLLPVHPSAVGLVTAQIPLQASSSQGKEPVAAGEISTRAERKAGLAPLHGKDQLVRDLWISVMAFTLTLNFSGFGENLNTTIVS